MKTKIWIFLLAAILLTCAALSLWLLWPREAARYAEVWSEGKLLYTLDLQEAQTRTVTTSRGTNVITVKDGKLAVTQADCPDGYCMDRGFCSGGMQIVCLPHQLIVQFLGQHAVDGAT